MSLARLVITAVTVEGRSKSEVARDYGITRFWVQTLVKVRRRGRGGVRAEVPKTPLQPAGGQPGDRGPDRPAPQDLDQEGPRRWGGDHRRASAGGRGRPGPGRVDDMADPVPPRVRGAAAAETAPVIVEEVCADQPNERWQADITHWRLADGSEVEILNILDDHSRVCIASVARTIFTGTQVWQVFLAAFGLWGVPAEVLTDNGAVFTGKQRGQGRVALEVQCGLRGVKVSHSRPYHPQTCGKVERFHQTLKKWLRAQACAATIAGLQRQLKRFCTYYNTIRPHRALGRRTPAQAYPARPKAVACGPVIPAHYRVRTDRIDRHGSVTVRHNSRLHHIGLGARHGGTPVLLLIDNLHIRVIGRHTGELIRELILDPTRDYQPRGLPPGPPKQSPTTSLPASRSRPPRATAVGVKAGRRPPAGPQP